MDVWVDPSGIDAVVDELAALGWAQRVAPTSAQLMPLHSVTVAHSAWPCEADVHHRIPGFGGEAGEVFELAWSERTVTTIAGVAVPSTNPAATALIQGLNELRDEGEGALIGDLARRIEALGLTEAIGRMAAATGSAGPLAPLLGELGLGHVVDQAPAPDEGWRLAIGSPGAKSVPALFELTHARWRDRPRLLVRSILLTEAEIRERQPNASPGWWGLQRARLRRIGWGLAALPSAVRSLRQARRSHDPRP